MTLKIQDFEFASHIETEADIVEYLQIFLEEDGIDGFVDALGHVAKKKGMSNIAKKAGISRQNLYRTLTENGQPYFYTVNAVLNAMGVKLDIKVRA